ncbi:MAG: cyclic nucleotide-binding domain-containing protein, partial [Acidimicrobiales bacterium]
MARNSKADQLQAVPLFSACTDKELAQIARVCDELVVEPDATVVEEGTAGDGFYLIVTGDAAVSREGQRVATVGPGQYFGELSLLDDGPRNATVTAQTPMT